MVKKFFTSDMHLGHANILKFKSKDGTLVRPGFKDVTHMNETIISNYNSVVGFDDIVYNLGDVTWSEKDLEQYMPRLNGRKILIPGNHDLLPAKIYLKYFDDVVGSRKIKHNHKWFIISHYPIHFDCNHPEEIFNVHGHTHEKAVITDHYEDYRYFNVGVERNNYTPVLIDDIIKKMPGW